MKNQLLILFLLFVMAACGGNETPKPRGFFRIALPEKSYSQFDTLFPYYFESPDYAQVIPTTNEWSEPYWADIVFSGFNARIHLSYKAIDNQNELYGYLEDAYTFIHRHIPKATSIRDEVFINEEDRVFGTLIRIRGREAASPLQFWATDSMQHFLRGALYFNVTPDNDSLAPVIDFLEEDIRHLLHTLEWD
jgi:gliding motility-associated lipoprotein GldD